jgi:hypothetical protein
MAAGADVDPVRAAAASRVSSMSAGERSSNRQFGPGPGIAPTPGTGVYRYGPGPTNRARSEGPGQRVNQGVQYGRPRGPRMLGSGGNSETRYGNPKKGYLRRGEQRA